MRERKNKGCWYAEGKRAYSIGNGAAHAANQTHTSATSVLYHLARRGLRGHKDTGHVDLQNVVDLFGWIFNGRDFLLNASCGYETVKTTMLVPYGLDSCIQTWDVTDVSLMVVERCTEVVGGPLGNFMENRRRLRKAVEGVN